MSSIPLPDDWPEPLSHLIPIPGWTDSGFDPDGVLEFLLHLEAENADAFADLWQTLSDRIAISDFVLPVKPWGIIYVFGSFSLLPTTLLNYRYMIIWEARTILVNRDNESLAGIGAWWNPRLKIGYVTERQHADDLCGPINTAQAA